MPRSATEHGNLNMFQFLLHLPYAPLMEAPNYSSHNILHYATSSRRIQDINIFLQWGFDLHATDHRGRTLFIMLLYAETCM